MPVCDSRSRSSCRKASTFRLPITSKPYGLLSVERVECDTIRSLDGAPADPELRSNFAIRVLCNAANDEHEPAKYVQASMNVFGVLDQQSKVLS